MTGNVNPAPDDAKKQRTLLIAILIGVFAVLAVVVCIFVFLVVPEVKSYIQENERKQEQERQRLERVAREAELRQIEYENYWRKYTEERERLKLQKDEEKRKARHTALKCIEDNPWIEREIGALLEIPDRNPPLKDVSVFRQNESERQGTMIVVFFPVDGYAPPTGKRLVMEMSPEGSGYRVTSIALVTGVTDATGPYPWPSARRTTLRAPSK